MSTAPPFFRFKKNNSFKQTFMCTLCSVQEVFALNICARECEFRSADGRGLTTGCSGVSSLANKAEQLPVLSKAAVRFWILRSCLLSDDQL